MPDATPPVGFGRPDLTTFARLDRLGLEVVGQRLEPDRAVLACRVAEPDQWCRRCGCEGAPRDSVSIGLARGNGASVVFRFHVRPASEGRVDFREPPARTRS